MEEFCSVLQKLITINLSYYNQTKDTLLKHINYWNSYDKHTKRKFIFYIIDDSSKIPVNEFFTGLLDSDKKYFRLKP